MPDDSGYAISRSVGLRAWVPGVLQDYRHDVSRSVVGSRT